MRAHPPDPQRMLKATVVEASKAEALWGSLASELVLASILTMRTGRETMFHSQKSVTSGGEGNAQTRHGLDPFKPERGTRRSEHGECGAPNLREILCCDAVRHETQTVRLPRELAVGESSREFLGHAGKFIKGRGQPTQVVRPATMSQER